MSNPVRIEIKCWRCEKTIMEGEDWSEYESGYVHDACEREEEERYRAARREMLAKIEAQGGPKTWDEMMLVGLHCVGGFASDTAFPKASGTAFYVHEGVSE